MRRKKREGGGKVERPIKLLEETYFGVEMRGMGGKILGPKGMLILLLLPPKKLKLFPDLASLQILQTMKEFQCDELVHADPYEVMGQVYRQQLSCLTAAFLMKTSSSSCCGQRGPESP
ncbi:hypothetical protein GBA52_015969 [Prunus armeniaca]|nr:hypothetical protein GBA52_015969 [Prunus armeniaca]